MSSTQQPPNPASPPSSSSYAAAVRPPNTMAVIRTDTAGLVAEDVKITTATGVLPAYRAAPDRPGPHPVVLVVQEIFGLHEYIRDVARRLAKLGYLAIAPDLYFRQGDATVYTDIDALRAEIVNKVPDEQVMADLDACYAWSREAGGDPARLGITGFCWGGRITWLYAAHQPRLKAAVAWYGKLTGPKNALQPRHPLDVSGQLKTPVLGLYGGEDPGIPMPQVEELRSDLKKVNSASQVLVYPGAPHAFHADYRPSYRPEAAEDGWQRMKAWFAQNGLRP
ncbi:dienelactone hydrolase family protein [Piscinibacter terrae]|uniref:Dienelactone hydrolase family protein n=1 Tax=Piscinibacter terrae TaxID=2496871 RepID=A0A3N7HR08_9BURK|nr:dienelactone hydrolase family protein [Albitalea terrae]RQP24634.1 dienelactone hydrolase family protein [Albitalea terrae]